MFHKLFYVSKLFVFQFILLFLLFLQPFNEFKFNHILIKYL